MSSFIFEDVFRSKSISKQSRLRTFWTVCGRVCGLVCGLSADIFVCGLSADNMDRAQIVHRTFPALDSNTGAMWGFGGGGGGAGGPAGGPAPPAEPQQDSPMLQAGMMLGAINGLATSIGQLAKTQQEMMEKLQEMKSEKQQQDGAGASSGRREKKKAQKKALDDPQKKAMASSTTKASSKVKKAKMAKTTTMAKTTKTTKTTKLGERVIHTHTHTHARTHTHTRTHAHTTHTHAHTHKRTHHTHTHTQPKKRGRKKSKTPRQLFYESQKIAEQSMRSVLQEKFQPGIGDYVNATTSSGRSLAKLKKIETDKQGKVWYHVVFDGDTKVFRVSARNARKPSSV